MSKYLIFISLIIVFASKNVNARTPDKPLIVGSKKFTESVILGEIITQLGKIEDPNVIHLKDSTIKIPEIK